MSLEKKGPKNTDELIVWLRKHEIDDVECLIADMSGIARGKIVPREKFINSLQRNSLHIPFSIFAQTVTGEYADLELTIDDLSNDLQVIPDPQTIRLAPWCPAPTAQIICDVHLYDSTPLPIAPREILKKVLKGYKDIGLAPILAPELEFYLVQKNNDADYELRPAKGQAGRLETASQAYGIEALNEYDPFIDSFYNYCEISELDIDTVLHESGLAQIEVNLLHGDPLELADQVFLIKRTARQAAYKNNIFATFMAKPLSTQPGSAMHVHVSLVDTATNTNVFDGGDTPYSKNFYNFVGGLQKFLPDATLLLYPNMNSFRRIRTDGDAPVNLEWDVDNRTVGIRVPHSSPSDRRVEVRLAGADTNPYLSFAAVLLSGLMGMQQKINPSAPITKQDGYNYPRSIPHHPIEAIERLESCKDFRQAIGADFVHVFTKIKRLEIDKFTGIVTPWEREFLLLSL